MKSLQSAIGEVKALREYFEKKRIKTISHQNVEDFKLKRYVNPDERTIAGIAQSLGKLNETASASDLDKADGIEGEGPF